LIGHQIFSMSRYSEFRHNLALYHIPEEKISVLRGDVNKLLNVLRNQLKAFPSSANHSFDITQTAWLEKTLAAVEDIQDLLDAFSDWKPRDGELQEDISTEVFASDVTVAMLPLELQTLVQETLALVRNNPKHEMGQVQRKLIYEALWSSSQGEKASRWLAVFAARRVQSIYEQGLASLPAYNTEYDVRFPHRMIEMGEKVLKGDLAEEDVRRSINNGTIEDFYHHLNLGRDRSVPKPAYLACIAAWEAFGEARGYRPFQSRSATQVVDENGNTKYPTNDTIPDSWLAGSGGGQGDAAVSAAYAFAGVNKEQYDADRLLEFWTWWLEQALPTAWVKASDGLL
jgi:hypothetical protein